MPNLQTNPQYTVKISTFSTETVDKHVYISVFIQTTNHLISKHNATKQLKHINFNWLYNQAHIFHWLFLAHT